MESLTPSEAGPRAPAGALEAPRWNAMRVRVLMTADTVGGVWTYALELVRALRESGVEVLLATMGDRLRPEQREEAASLTNLRVLESTYRLEWMEDPWEDVRAAGEWLLDLERTWNPDLVHLNGYAHGALPWRTQTLVVGHSCVCSWFCSVKGCQAPWEWETYRREVGAGLRAASAVTAPSGAMLRALEEQYGTFASVAPIHNGREATFFHPLPKEPLIFTAGRLWDEAKNAAAVDRAAEGLPWPAYVAGEDRHPGGGRARFRTLGSAGRLSPRDMAQWLGRASIFALPARYEPFGLCALEAGLAGCALVLGDIPSLREVWGDAALFVPPNDCRALHDTLEALIGDEALRAALAVRARRRALSYTPQRMARAYLELYRSILRMPQSLPPSLLRPDPCETA